MAALIECSPPGSEDKGKTIAVFWMLLGCSQLRSKPTFDDETVVHGAPGLMASRRVGRTKLATQIPCGNDKTGW